MEVDLELYREELLISEEPPVRLSYIEVAPQNPAGTMVFVHGYGGYAMQWKNQLKAFSDNYRVIAYDVRGHGRSDAPYTSYTMDDTQADLDALLEKLNVQLPFILVGHSFGGAIVAEFAHRRPQDLSHLVLIATLVLVVQLVESFGSGGATSIIELWIAGSAWTFKARCSRRSLTLWIISFQARRFSDNSAVAGAARY